MSHLGPRVELQQTHYLAELGSILCAYSIIRLEKYLEYSIFLFARGRRGRLVFEVLIVGRVGHVEDVERERVARAAVQSRVVHVVVQILVGDGHIALHALVVELLGGRRRLGLYRALGARPHAARVAAGRVSPGRLCVGLQFVGAGALSARPGGSWYGEVVTLVHRRVGVRRGRIVVQARRGRQQLVAVGGHVVIVVVHQLPAERDHQVVAVLGAGAVQAFVRPPP